MGWATKKAWEIKSAYKSSKTHNLARKIFCFIYEMRINILGLRDLTNDLTCQVIVYARTMQQQQTRLYFQSDIPTCCSQNTNCWQRRSKCFTYTDGKPTARPPKSRTDVSGCLELPQTISKGNNIIFSVTTFVLTGFNVSPTSQLTFEVTFFLLWLNQSRLKFSVSSNTANFTHHYMLRGMKGW